MGIILPPDDIIVPPSGYSCPFGSIDDMQPVFADISGVVNLIGGGSVWVPNGTHKLIPVGTCRWKRYYQIGTFDWVSVIFDLGETSWLTVALNLTAVFEGSNDTGKWVFENVLTWPWSGGSCSVSYIDPAWPSSVKLLAADLGIDYNTGKTFLEPAGQDPATNTYNQRLARQRDGTCVYIKR
jgi:hypothetical protein